MKIGTQKDVECTKSTTTKPSMKQPLPEIIIMKESNINSVVTTTVKDGLLSKDYLHARKEPNVTSSPAVHVEPTSTGTGSSTQIRVSEKKSMSNYDDASVVQNITEMATDSQSTSSSNVSSKTLHLKSKPTEMTSLELSKSSLMSAKDNSPLCKKALNADSGQDNFADLKGDVNDDNMITTVDSNRTNKMSKKSQNGIHCVVQDSENKSDGALMVPEECKEDKNQEEEVIDLFFDDADNFDQHIEEEVVDLFFGDANGLDQNQQEDDSMSEIQDRLNETPLLSDETKQNGLASMEGEHFGDNASTITIESSSLSKAIDITKKKEIIDTLRDSTDSSESVLMAVLRCRQMLNIDEPIDIIDNNQGERPNNKIQDEEATGKRKREESLHTTSNKDKKMKSHDDSKTTEETTQRMNPAEIFAKLKAQRKRRSMPP